MRDKVVDGAILSIYSIVFLEDRSWELSYEGNKISAKVADDDFLAKVHSREIKFAKGDRLKCRLVIKQILNKDYNIYENKFYYIEQVDEIIPPDDQEKLDF